MIKYLMPLIGRWTGRGTAIYPGFETSNYDEIWTVQADEATKLLQYENKSRRLNGDLLAWEFGFIRPTGELRIDMINSQNNGRVEVLKGEVIEREQGLELSLITHTFGNDPRMISAERHIHISGDELRYQVIIATQAAPQAFEHLSAVLRRDV